MRPDFRSFLRKDNLLLGSDCAGEIIAVGDDVHAWKKGDRVCVNFSPAHIHGHANVETATAALGGLSDGVLTEYRSFPANVSCSHLITRACVS